MGLSSQDTRATEAEAKLCQVHVARGSAPGPCSAGGSRAWRGPPRGPSPRGGRRAWGSQLVPIRTSSHDALAVGAER
eukprot:3013557-Pyramimonas_sp.AAC.1